MTNPHRVIFKPKRGKCKRIVHMKRRKVLPLFNLIENCATKWNMKVQRVDW